MQIRAPGRHGGNVEQEWGGNIVREVAYDSQGRGQRRKVEAQCIGLVHCKAVDWVPFTQALAQISVELDNVKVLDAF